MQTARRSIDQQRSRPRRPATAPLTTLLAAVLSAAAGVARADPAPPPPPGAPLIFAAGASARVAETEGDRLVRAGDIAGAAKAYSAAAAADPDEPLFQITAGVALAATGSVDGAIMAFRRAQRLAGGDAVVDFLLAGATAERPAIVLNERQNTLPNAVQPNGGGGFGGGGFIGGYGGRGGAAVNGSFAGGGSDYLQQNLQDGRQDAGQPPAYFTQNFTQNQNAFANAAPADRTAPGAASKSAPAGPTFMADARRSVGRLTLAVQQYPDSPVIQMLLGDAYQISAQWGDAEEHYRRAIALAPLWSKPLVNLGLAQLAEGRTGVAIQTFQSALALDPGNALANLGKGDAERTAGRADAALAAYANVANSNNAAVAAQANAGIGQVFADRGQYTDAYRAFNRATALDPTDPAPVAALGATQYLGGDYAGAATSYRTALQLSQSDVVASTALLRQALSEAQLAAHDPAAAITTVQQALVAEPSTAGVWYRLWARALFDERDTAGGKAKLVASFEADMARHEPGAALRALASRGLLPAVTGDYAGALDRTVSPPDRLRLLTLLTMLSAYQLDAPAVARWRLELVQLQPSGPNWFALAVADERAGDPASARDAYARALGFGDLPAADRAAARARIMVLVGAAPTAAYPSSTR